MGGQKETNIIENYHYFSICPANKDDFILRAERERQPDSKFFFYIRKSSEQPETGPTHYTVVISYKDELNQDQVFRSRFRIEEKDSQQEIVFLSAGTKKSFGHILIIDSQFKAETLGDRISASFQKHLEDEKEKAKQSVPNKQDENVQTQPLNNEPYEALETQPANNGPYDILQTQPTNRFQYTLFAKEPPKPIVFQHYNILPPKNLLEI